MKKWIQVWFALLILMAWNAPCRASDIVDRVVAVVNGHLILQSDWEEEIASEAFLNARAGDSYTAVERQEALDRLIDRELLREQVRSFDPAPAAQVAARVAEVRKQHPEALTDDGWLAALKRNGLTQGALEK